MAVTGGSVVIPAKGRGGGADRGYLVPWGRPAGGRVLSEKAPSLAGRIRLIDRLMGRPYSVAIPNFCAKYGDLLTKQRRASAQLDTLVSRRLCMLPLCCRKAVVQRPEKSLAQRL